MRVLRPRMWDPYLEHRQQEMLFAALILVAVDGEHDRLEEGIDLGHGDQATEMRNVSRLGLEEEEQIPVFLRLLVVREEALLQIGRILEMARDFILLYVGQHEGGVWWGVSSAYLLQRHAILNQQGDPRIQISDILLQHEILLGL